MVLRIFKTNHFKCEEGALKITGISNSTFLKAVNEGIIKPRLVKNRKKTRYLESKVLKIEKKRKRRAAFTFI